MVGAGLLVYFPLALLHPGSCKVYFPTLMLHLLSFLGHPSAGAENSIRNSHTSECSTIPQGLPPQDLACSSFPRMNLTISQGSLKSFALACMGAPTVSITARCTTANLTKWPISGPSIVRNTTSSSSDPTPPPWQGMAYQRSI